MRASSAKALRRLMELLDSQDEQMRRKAGNDILSHTMRLEAAHLK